MLLAGTGVLMESGWGRCVGGEWVGRVLPMWVGQVCWWRVGAAGVLVESGWGRCAGGEWAGQVCWRRVGGQGAAYVGVVSHHVPLPFQMTQLEAKLKDDKTAHGRSLERELEQFKHQCERDADKLKMRIRIELENRVSLIFISLWLLCYI